MNLPAILIALAFFCEAAYVPAVENAIRPKVEKDAHAEAILWEIWVSDQRDSVGYHTEMKHTMKVAVFDERGAEMLSKVDIPHLGAVHISDVWARTVKKGGEI